MCGISVVFGPKDHPAHQHRKAKNILHRGPDGTGIAYMDLPGGRVSMMVHRLAIVGGEGVDIPFRHHEGLLIAFNGEIYNWQPLREELTKKGATWRTNCDVEVLAEAWRQWGHHALDRIDGQFAFAIADETTGTLTAARDRAGEKSLYTTFSDDDFEAVMFASEIKALDVEFKEGPCQELDLYEYDCRDNTPFDGIFAFPPAHYETIESPKDSPNATRYWKVPEKNSIKTDRDLLQLLRGAILQRVPQHVPWTVLVSGGLDSAIMQAIVKAPVVYTLAFDEPGFDDTPAAKLAAAGAELRVVTFSKEDVYEALPKIAWHLDTPATWTAIGQWFLAKQIKEDGFKVVLSGEGADEVFGGYTRYLLLKKLEEILSDPVLGHQYLAMTSHQIGSMPEILAKMYCRGESSSINDFVPYFDDRKADIDLIDPARRFEFDYGLQCLLRMADRMFMAHGIEPRCPYLAREIIEYGYGAERECISANGFTKQDLRLVAGRLGVPRSITHNKDKRGFAIPWNLWHQADVAEQGGSRGQWGRAHFAQMMRDTWRRAFSLPTDR